MLVDYHRTCRAEYLRKLAEQMINTQQAFLLSKGFSHRRQPALTDLCTGTG